MPVSTQPPYGRIVFGDFVAFLEALSHRSYDLAAECMTLGQQLFPLIGGDKGAVISLASQSVPRIAGQ